MKKKIDKLFEIITKRVDFVNLIIKVKFFKGFEIYNNNDRIAFLTFEDTHVLLMLGTQFFCSIVYSLCVKYSIEKPRPPRPNAPPPPHCPRGPPF